MVDKPELVAFEREKRLYKDAYVDNFRSVRYFPSLATIGAGRTDGDSIVLVQEQQVPVAERTPAKEVRSGLNNVASRLVPPDSLEEIFATTLPLTMFRSAVMCKHSKARQERRAAETSCGVSAFKAGLAAAPNGSRGRTSSNMRNIGLMHAHDRQPGVFKPTSVVEAKGAIQRKVTYDGQPFQDKPRAMRSVTPRTGAPPPWVTNNPASARKGICNRTYFNVPLEGPIKADRKYTQEFIRLSMEAYHAGRSDAAKDDKGDSRHDH